MRYLVSNVAFVIVTAVIMYDEPMTLVTLKLLIVGGAISLWAANLVKRLYTK
nr:MAG TPA: hypothetical protein [Caudoviricetes sp.]